MKTKKELLLEAQQEQITAVAGCRVTVLKGLDELKEFGGEDTYEVNLPIIVNAYPEGIEQSRVREVLPDAVKLAKAIKELKGKEIEVQEISARIIVLKPLKKDTVPPATRGTVSVDTNPMQEPGWEPVPTSSAPKKPTPKLVEPKEEETEQ